ncbi:MAG TPA: zinc-binding alcohol dehydrogenase [Opitutus sp.]|nr:zinc-binding alcohol dehydrogenase [Opitutus sp.]
MKTTALFMTGIDRVELIDANVPDPGPDDVVVESLHTAISPGTELRCLAGRQHGGTFPFIPGYSMVGRVIARGARAAIAEGTNVFCLGTERADRPLLWGAHIGHAVRPAASVFPLPADADPHDFALAKVAAIAYRGVRVAQTRPHEEVAVVGLGLIGQLAARLHRLAGARVVAADLDASRVAVARSAGVDAHVPASGLRETFARAQPHGADVVVDSTGAGPVLQQTLQLAKPKPWDDTVTEPTRLVIQGSYADDVVFDYHEAFCRELTVFLPRDHQPRDLVSVLSFIADGRLRTRDLVSEIRPPREAPAVYAALRAAQPGLITAVFDWSRS